MKNRNVFFTAGIMAAFMAAFAGCVNPLSSTMASRETPSDSSQTAPSVDAPSAGVQPEEFTVTLRTGAAGASRAVVGPGAGTIQYGSIRNTAQVIVVDNDGAVVDFEQVRRESDGQSAATIEVKNIDTGSTYHFLVLMGHQERTYTEGPGEDYVYKDNQAPTLLAAGFTTATISGEVGETVTVAMRPVVVDTEFEYNDTITGAALAGVTLRKDASAELTWTLTNGFTPLINAQKILYSNANTLRFKAGKTIVRHSVNGDVSVNINPPLGGNVIRAAISTDVEGAGSAYFNLNYAPFNLTGGTAWSEFFPFDSGVFADGDTVPVWIIRNGINDTAQNNNTVFPDPAETSPCPWNGTAGDKYNGNGAVRFSVEGLNQDLTIYVPAPVTGGTPVTSFAGPQYTGTVAWTNVTAPDAPVPVNGPFVEARVYQAEVTLHAAPDWPIDGLGADSFTHSGADPQAAQPDPNPYFAAGVVTITFKATDDTPAQVVNLLDLAPHIPAPEPDRMPVQFFAGTQYRGEVTWFYYTGSTYSPHNGAFGAGTVYKATVKLTAASGYTFTDPPGTVFFEYSGAEATKVECWNNPNEVEITFETTDSFAVVSDLDLTTKVLRPEAGVTAVKTIFVTQYTGTVDWDTKGTNDNVSKFVAGTFYVATVTLKAAPGYTFKDIDAGSFTYSGGTVTHSAAESPYNTLEVTINFPATAGPITQEVTKFGPDTDDTSALYLMNRTKDSGPLTITLIAGTEPLTPGTVNITRAAGQENTPRTVTINGGSRTLESDGSGSGTLITLTGDGYAGGLVVTLTNITIQGTSGLDAPLVRLEGKARLVLGSGAIIQGNSDSASHGGGVYIGPGSVLEMGGGSVIKDNSVKPDASGTSVYGGGVYNDGGTFTMNSGSTLSDNKSLKTNGTSAYGGGVYINNGTFTMKTGSVLSGSNYVDNTQVPPAPVYVPNGGGVHLAGSNTVFEMSGGSITGNTAGVYGGGVYCYAGTFKMSGGSISGNSSESGGGVCVVNAAFRMSGGAISTNEATASKGGGVYVNSSNAVFEMSGGILSENTAKTHGGGVYVGGGKFEMRNSEISFNKVLGNDNPDPLPTTPPVPNYYEDGGNGGGGGVCVVNAEFAMSGGALIAENDAMISNGGGVHLGTGAVFTMSGGIISANHAKVYGGGVYVRDGKFDMKGSEISSNWVSGTGTSGGGGGVAIHKHYNTTASSGTFTMKSGAKISGNRARNSQLKAGGVLVDSSAGDFKMQNGSEICENQANLHAGGVMIERGTFSMETGSSIRNNTVTTNYGNHYNAGGLYLGAQVTAPVNVAGVISGNKVVVSSDGLVQESGGGVYNASKGTFTLQSGGVISGNDVTGTLSGGGVCHITGGTFKMDAGSSINNNRVYSRVITSNTTGELYIGGGVYLSASEASMTMYGSISYNEANYNGTEGNYVGGGVLIKSTLEKGRITISGSSVVTYNKAGGNSNVQGGILNENTDIVGTGQISGNIP